MLDVQHVQHVQQQALIRQTASKGVRLVDRTDTDTAPTEVADFGPLQSVKFYVPGKPAPQGSKRHVGGGRMIESSKELGPWRERVAIAAYGAAGTMFAKGEPLAVAIEFVMPRPGSAPKRSTPPAVKRPDVDKLARAVLDAITDVLIHDDSAVVALHATKRLAGIDEPAHAHIAVAIAGGVAA